jgi:hypothetical protein
MYRASTQPLAHAKKLDDGGKLLDCAFVELLHFP